MRVNVYLSFCLFIDRWLDIMKKTTTRNVQYCWVSILDYYSTLLTSNSTSTYYLPILSEAYFSTIHSAPSIYYGVSRPADRLPCTRQFSLVHLPTSYLLYTSSSFLSADFCTSQVESVEVEKTKHVCLHVLNSLPALPKLNIY